MTPPLRTAPRALPVIKKQVILDQFKNLKIIKLIQILKTKAVLNHSCILFRSLCRKITIRTAIPTAFRKFTQSTFSVGAIISGRFKMPICVLITLKRRANIRSCFINIGRKIRKWGFGIPFAERWIGGLFFLILFYEFWFFGIVVLHWDKSTIFLYSFRLFSL